MELMVLPDNTYFTYYCHKCNEVAHYSYLDGKEMKYVCAKCAKKE
ncbi:MAG: hypothetical protein ACI35O_10105 [Bacillaceae bacterium]